MGTRNTYPPGLPCWVAVLAPDTDAARAFYAAIFDWSFNNVAPAGDPPFYIATLHGDRVAGLFGPDQPGTWITAVSVHELDIAVGNATRAGGTAPGESIEIPTLGRFHRLLDPAGAEIHVMQPLDDSAASRLNEPGAWSMSSLSVSDPSSVAPFYESLFGWQAKKSGPATLFRLPGYVGGTPEQQVPRDVVAVMKHADAAADAGWTPDFWVPTPTPPPRRPPHEAVGWSRSQRSRTRGCEPLCSPTPGALGSPSASCCTVTDADATRGQRQTIAPVDGNARRRVRRGNVRLRGPSTRRPWVREKPCGVRILVELL